MFPPPSHPPEPSILVPCPEHRALTDPYDPCLVTVITTWENVSEKQSGAWPRWPEAEVVEAGKKGNTEKIFYFPHTFLSSACIPCHYPLNTPSPTFLSLYILFQCHLCQKCPPASINSCLSKSYISSMMQLGLCTVLTPPFPASNFPLCLWLDTSYFLSLCSVCLGSCCGAPWGRVPSLRPKPA